MVDSPEKQERIFILAEQVKQLFAFCGMLIPDLDLLEKVTDVTRDSHSHAQALFPVMGAVGMDARETELETEVRAKRSAALLNLVKVIKETEEERVEFQRQHVDNVTARNNIARSLGL